MATILMADSQLTNLMVGSVLGMAGFLTEKLFVDATKPTTSTGSSTLDSIFSGITGFYDAIDEVFNFFLEGEWKWYFAAAGAGVLANVLASQVVQGSKMLPIVSSFTAGFALRYAQDTLTTETSFLPNLNLS